MSGPTQYWWNDTAIEYACDERTPEDAQWKEFELVSERTKMKATSAPFCNATATYRGGSFVSISGGISKDGSTWGCSVDGKQWVWYSAEGNGESWKTQVLCAWDNMSSKDDIQTWLSSDPSGKTAIAIGSWIGLPSDKGDQDKTSTVSFFPTISQPVPTDLEETPAPSSTSSSDITTKPDDGATVTATSTSNGATGQATATEAGKSIDSKASTRASAAASTSNSQADSIVLDTTLAAASTGSPTNSDPTSSPNSSITIYIVVGVGTFVVVGAILLFILCLHKGRRGTSGRNSRHARGASDTEDDTLLSSDSDSGSSSFGGSSRRSNRKRSTVDNDY